MVGTAASASRTLMERKNILMSSNPNQITVRGYFRIRTNPRSQRFAAADVLMKNPDFRSGYLVRADVMNDARSRLYNDLCIIAPFVATNIPNVDAQDQHLQDLQGEVVEALRNWNFNVVISIERSHVTEYFSPEIAGNPNHNPDDGGNGPGRPEPADIEEDIIIGGGSNLWG